MKIDSKILDLIEVISSFATPLILLIIGIIINRKLEKRKIGLTKQKDWETKWANEFFDLALEFNNCISVIIFNLSFSQDPNMDKEFKQKLIDEAQIKLYRINSIEWDIQNFAQFSDDKGKAIKESQNKLIKLIHEIMKNKGGDIEGVRQVQFSYNKAVRRAQKEILKLE